MLSIEKKKGPFFGSPLLASSSCQEEHRSEGHTYYMHPVISHIVMASRTSTNIRDHQFYFSRRHLFKWDIVPAMPVIPRNLKPSTHGIEPRCMPSTPDNFGQTPTSPVCSPPANQIFDEHLNTPELHNISLARQSSIVTRKIPRWVKYDMATRLCIIFQVELTQLLIITRIN